MVAMETVPFISLLPTLAFFSDYRKKRPTLLTIFFARLEPSNGEAEM